MNKILQFKAFRKDPDLDSGPDPDPDPYLSLWAAYHRREFSSSFN